MFIAIHQQSDQLVSGIDILDPESSLCRTDSYRCLLCSESVKFERGDEQYQFFTHTMDEDDCFYDPKNSHVHQTACQKAIKTFCTRLDCDRSSVELETEVRKGGAMTRADVLISDPDPIAIEVFYKSRMGALYRKLNVLLSNGYSCYVICVADRDHNLAHTPEQFDRSLQKYGPVEVGRYLFEFNRLSIGTRITDELVDLVPPRNMEEDDYRLFG